MSNPAKGRADYWKPGDWNALCYQCGRKRKAGELMRYWQGYYVCPEHWETRQPQDFVRAVPDVQTVPWAQPVGVDGIPQLFVTIDESDDEYEVEVSTATVTAVNYTLVIITILEGVYIGVLDLTGIPAGWTVQINNYGGVGFIFGSATVTQGPGKPLPAQIDPNVSTVVAVPDTINESPDTSTVTVTLLTILGVAVPGATVRLASDPTTSTITPSSVISDGSGQAAFSFESDTPGVYAVAARVRTGVLTQQPEITVNEPFILTAAVIGMAPNRTWGFDSDEAMGSISPTDWEGVDWIAVFVEENSGHLVVKFDGSLAQTFFTSITVNGSTLLSADVLTFFVFAGVSTWIWVATPFTSTGTFDVSVTA